jgi:hypothetical protein
MDYQFIKMFMLMLHLDYQFLSNNVTWMITFSKKIVVDVNVIHVLSINRIVYDLPKC